MHLQTALNLVRLTLAVESPRRTAWYNVHTAIMIPRNINLKTGGRDQESPNSAFVASRLPAKNQPSCWLRSGPLAGDLEPHTSVMGLCAAFR